MQLVLARLIDRVDLAVEPESGGLADDELRLDHDQTRHQRRKILGRLRGAKSPA